MENNTLNILLIEDNPGDVRLIEEYLKETSINYRLTVTDRISDAILKVKNDYDLILTDLGLPDSSGINTLKQLKETGTNIPIVVLTGLNNEEIALISLKEGAQDYLVKNILNSKNLSRSIKFTLERKKIEDKKSLLLNILHSLTSQTSLDIIVQDIKHYLKEYTKFDFISLKFNDFTDNQYQKNYSFISKLKDNSSPHCTKYGSFWTADGNTNNLALNTNGYEDFLKLISFNEDYGSFALIPVRSGDKIIGLLEFADAKSGIFNKELIEFYEGIAKSIGIGIMRIKAEEEIKIKKKTPKL